jgi:AcrR family transcriptional regulator
MKRKRGRPSLKTIKAGYNARDAIISAASKLFYANGYNAVGVDDIAKTAQVAKMTFFKHFKNKNELVEETLKYRSHKFSNWFKDCFETQTNLKKKNVERVIEVIEIWFTHKNFKGCFFLKAKSEIDPQSMRNQVLCNEHINNLLKFIEKMARLDGFQDPKLVANQLLTVIHGANARAQFDSSKMAVQVLKNTSQAVIENQRLNKI